MALASRSLAHDLGAGAMNPETKIQREVKHKLNVTKRCRLIRNNVGFAKEEKIPFGLGKGSPDLIGPLRGGIVFGLEIKTPTGSISADQRAWWRAAYRWGVRGGVCRSLEGAFRALDAAEGEWMHTGEVIDYE